MSLPRARIPQAAARPRKRKERKKKKKKQKQQSRVLRDRNDYFSGVGRVNKVGREERSRVLWLIFPFVWADERDMEGKVMCVICITIKRVRDGQSM